jgi:hypothetical protein
MRVPAGIFGMNLHSGLEQTAVAFPYTVVPRGRHCSGSPNRPLMRAAGGSVQLGISALGSLLYGCYHMLYLRSQSRVVSMSKMAETNDFYVRPSIVRNR